MIMLYLTANISMLDQIRSALDLCGAESYQVIERAWAKSVKGDKRLDNAVWPGYNLVIFAQLEESVFSKVEKAVKEMNQKAHNDNELITWASWELNNFNFK